MLFIQGCGASVRVARATVAALLKQGGAEYPARDARRDAPHGVNYQIIWVIYVFYVRKIRVFQRQR